jgi:protoporphyrinogen/coproporphyrinogen III oxidase
MEYEMLIIGAGISGLSMAHYCTQLGLNTQILEREPRSGGAFHTQRFSEQGFWLELGAHSCFNSYGSIIGLIEQHGLMPQLIKKRNHSFKLWNGREMLSLANQLNYLELIYCLPRMFVAAKNDKTVAEYYKYILGEQNYHQVLSHAFNAVICQTADNFPATMLFRKKPRRRDIVRNFTFKSGLQALPEAVAERLAIKYNVEVKQISYDGEKFTVYANSGKQYVAKYVTLATPVQVSAAITKDYLTEIHNILSVVQAVKIETIGVVVEKQHLKLQSLGGIIGRNTPFYSAVARDAVEHSYYRGFTFHFKPNQLNNDEKLDYLCGVLGVNKSLIQDVITKQNYLPAPIIGHQQLVQKLTTTIDKLPLFITGNYFNGVSAEDCVLRSVEEFQRLQHKFISD